MLVLCYKIAYNIQKADRTEVYLLLSCKEYFTKSDVMSCRLYHLFNL